MTPHACRVSQSLSASSGSWRKSRTRLAAWRAPSGPLQRWSATARRYAKHLSIYKANGNAGSAAGMKATIATLAQMKRGHTKDYRSVPVLTVSPSLQLADAAIEEQLEVQTAFREHGARLQQIYDKRQRTDMDIARREQEMKQLQGAALIPAILILCHYVCTHGPFHPVYLVAPVRDVFASVRDMSAPRALMLSMLYCHRLEADGAEPDRALH